MERRAKIVVTLGPATSSPEAVVDLLREGADVVRLNLSHGNQEQHRRFIAEVRRAAEELERHVPVLLDLMGPRYRLAPSTERKTLEPGAEVRLGPEGSGADLPLDGAELIRHLQKGERVLIDNGLVELEVLTADGDEATTKVVTGGPVAPRKGINLPDTELPFHITRKDRADIAFAVQEDVDYLAVSFVGTGADLEAVREVARESGEPPPLVAKLERAAAINHIPDIVAAADALMVARGDMGVEVPLDRVPVLQKQIIAAGRRTGKPVIVATQMLESMMDRPRPTRAESTDVANAVLDGADALMLSGETAAGKHPHAAVSTMAKIILSAEEYQRMERTSTIRLSALDRAGQTSDGRQRSAEVVCAAAVLTADKLGVRRIVAYSQGGFTARSIARFRPTAPILVFTPDDKVARQVQLVWGVRPKRIVGEVDDPDDVVCLVDDRLQEADLASPDETVVILMGSPVRQRALTNLLRVHRVGSC